MSRNNAKLHPREKKTHAERHIEALIYLTSDTHGLFGKAIAQAHAANITSDDILIILGDASLDRYLDERDVQLKEHVLSNIPATIIVVRGNHDACPKSSGYHTTERFGGEIYQSDTYPRLFCVVDGEIYTIEDKRILCFGGALTIQPEEHMAAGIPVFNDSQPNEEDRKAAQERMGSAPTVDVVLSHTCPWKFVDPTFLHPEYDQSVIDHTLEEWLDEIESQITYKAWVFGHFHYNRKTNEKATCLCNQITPLDSFLE